MSKKANQTEERSLEETIWSEREAEIAKQFGVKPNIIHSLRQVIEDVFADQNYIADIDRFVDLTLAVFVRFYSMNQRK